VLIAFFFISINAQETTIKFDYTVTYEIENAGKANDTILVSYNKEGTYIYTNAQIFTKNVFNEFLYYKTDYSSASSNIILDTQSGELYFYLNFEESIFFFKTSINNFIPTDYNDISEDEETFITSEKKKEKSMFFGKEYPIYSVFPTNEPEDAIDIVFDESIYINNNNLFNRLFNLMGDTMNKDKNMTIDIPNGIILAIYEKNENIIKAIDLNTNPFTINISHTFKIEK